LRCNDQFFNKNLLISTIFDAASLLKKMQICAYIFAKLTCAQ